jgi:hypothetical protein
LKRRVEALRKRIGHTIAEIEPRLGMNALAIAGIGFEGCGNVRLGKRHDLNAERI